MNVHDLLRRYSIQSPVIYEKKRNGEWVKLERLPAYTILEVEMNDHTIEAVAIDVFKAITVSAKSRRRLKKLVRMLCVSRLNEHKKSRNFTLKLRLFLCGVLFGFVLWICPFCVIHERCRHPRNHKLGHVCRDKDVPPNAPLHSPECDDAERERINQL